MVVIDYLGFRLLATSLLPINPTTIVYGSSDACKTVHWNEEAANELKAVAAVLNLKVRTSTAFGCVGLRHYGMSRATLCHMLLCGACGVRYQGTCCVLGSACF